MSNNNTSSFELEYVIVGAKAVVSFEEGYFDEDEQHEIEEYVEKLSKRIYIDRSYVDSKQNKRTSTFMVEDGWNAMRDALLDSEYGKYLHPNNYPRFIEAMVIMAQCYLYECLTLNGYDISHINISIDNEPFDVIICKDRSNDWKNYAGKWQDWEFDENGHYVKTKSK